jgi:hypothetical protein
MDGMAPARHTSPRHQLRRCDGRNWRTAVPPREFEQTIAMSSWLTAVQLMVPPALLSPTIDGTRSAGGLLRDLT